MPDHFGVDFKIFGLDVKTIVAGMSGGLSFAFAIRKPKPWELVAGLIVGGLTANYVTPTAAEMSGFPILMTAFFVGGLGKFICLRALVIFQAWLPPKEQ